MNSDLNLFDDKKERECLERGLSVMHDHKCYCKRPKYELSLHFGEKGEKDEKGERDEKNEKPCSVLVCIKSSCKASFTTINTRDFFNNTAEYLLNRHSSLNSDIISIILQYTSLSKTECRGYISRTPILDKEKKSSVSHVKKVRRKVFDENGRYHYENCPDSENWVRIVSKRGAKKVYKGESRKCRDKVFYGKDGSYAIDFRYQ